MNQNETKSLLASSCYFKIEVLIKINKYIKK